MASLVIVSCNSDDEAVVDPNSTDGTPLTAGTADFSKYVALGDSFAAGFSDNAIIEIPAANEMVGRIRDISGSEAKYIEFEITVNGKKKFASLGSLLRSYKTSETDEKFIRPNAENNLTDLLAAICGARNWYLLRL